MRSRVTLRLWDLYRETVKSARSLATCERGFRRGDLRRAAEVRAEIVKRMGGAA